MANIFAHTNTDGSYPAYISVNDSPIEQISITVRSQRQHDGREGSCATITLDRTTFASLCVTLGQSLLTALEDKLAVKDDRIADLEWNVKELEQQLEMLSNNG